jgi:hypothetical protein
MEKRDYVTRRASRAAAFANKQRELLGIYMDLRDRIPKKHFVWATTESLPIGAPSFCDKVLP